MPTGTGKLCFVIGLYQFGGCLCLSDEGTTSRLEQIPQGAVELSAHQEF
jgi:hypothetical protein